MRPDIKFASPLREAQKICTHLVNRVNPVPKIQSNIFAPKKSAGSESTLDNQQLAGESKVNPGGFMVSFGGFEVGFGESWMIPGDSNPSHFNGTLKIPQSMFPLPLHWWVRTGEGAQEPEKQALCLKIKELCLKINLKIS